MATPLPNIVLPPVRPPFLVIQLTVYVRHYVRPKCTETQPRRLVYPPVRMAISESPPIADVKKSVPKTSLETLFPDSVSVFVLKATSEIF